MSDEPQGATPTEVRIRKLLAGFTDYPATYAHYIPSQGWAVCWKSGNDYIPICHMRWTDGMRPEIEARLEAEVKFFAAAPLAVKVLLSMLDGLRTSLASARDEALEDAAKVIETRREKPEWVPYLTALRLLAVAIRALKGAGEGEKK